MRRSSRGTKRSTSTSTTSRPNNPKRPQPKSSLTPSEAEFERTLAELLGETLDAARVPATMGLREFVDDTFAHRGEYARDRFASIADAASFHSKIVGVSFEGRQDVVAGLREGARLELVRQPDHEKDPNAIAVCYGALQLGYVRAGIARHIAPLMDSGTVYRASADHVTGGGTKHHGVNITVERDVPAAIARQRESQIQRRSSWSERDAAADAVRRALIGDSSPHDKQLRVLDRIDRGQNTLAIFGTGRGKSFCFQYPAVVRALSESGHKTLAIYPLRALANDQYEALERRLEPFGVQIFRANGSIGSQEREDLFEALREGAWDLILATPEFFSFHREKFSGPSAPSLVVVDEAHHVSESRHRAAYAALGENVSALGNPQVLALTATAGTEAFRRIRDHLRIEAWVIDKTVRENLRLVDARKERDKLAYLARAIGSNEKAIVYCNSRDEVGKIAERLRSTLGDRVMFYHAGMPSLKRRRIEDLFRDGELRVIVATSAFGEGIDLPDVRHVALYHLNFSFTEFNQQAGRAGRDGAPASVHLLFNEKDRRLNEFILERDSPPLHVLRRIYAGIKGLARNGIVRGSDAEVAREIDDRLDERTVRAALRMFEQERLLEAEQEDDGRSIRIRTVAGRIDLTRNERFAEGEAEKESFSRFAEMALTANVDDLQRLVDRPIYPDVAEML